MVGKLGRLKGEGDNPQVVNDITEREKAEEKLKKKVQELEKFHKIAVGRETKIVELKKRIKELEEQLNKKNIIKKRGTVNPVSNTISRLCAR